MGLIEGFEKEKLIAGVLMASSISISEVIDTLEGEWGSLDHQSHGVPFDFTSYYDGEMGPGIRRFYFSFEKLRNPEELSRIKNRSNSLELLYKEDEKRLVNIDPGFLSLTRLVLASSKDAGHRIPLSEGVYGEVTLLYQSGGFKTLDWTYPDYKSEFCHAEMRKIREKYKKQRRG